MQNNKSLNNKTNTLYLRIEKLEREIKELELQRDLYFDNWINVSRKYKELTEFISTKAFANPSSNRYRTINNFVKKIEEEN